MAMMWHILHIVVEFCFCFVLFVVAVFKDSGMGLLND